MIYATLRATQSFATTTAAVTASARVLVAGDSTGPLEQDFAADAAVLIQPRLQLDDGAGGTIAGVDVVYPAIVQSWAVDGIEPGAILYGDLRVGSDLEACARTWKRPVIASSGSRRAGDMASGPLGYEVERAGPPPGRSVPVDFSLQLVGRQSLAGSSSTLTLLTGGLVETSSRSWGASGHIMEMEGSGPEAAWRDVEVDLELPPGHGLTQGEIVRLIMSAAGIPDALIGVDPELGSPRTVPVVERCRPLWQLIHEILRPIGYVVMPGREDGIYREVALEPASDDVATIELTDMDLDIEAGIGFDADATVPTCAVVTGHRLADDGAGIGSGTVTASVTVSTYEDAWSLPLAESYQAPTGTIFTTGYGLSAPRDGVLTARTRVEVTTENGCEVLTYTKTEGYYNPPAARYIPSTSSVDGEPRSYPSFNVWFFDATPTADDATEGYLWSAPRFTVVTEVWSRPQWSATDRRIGTITDYGGWYNPRKRIKSRISPASSWETTNYSSGQLSGGFQGLALLYEHYFKGPSAPSSTINIGTSGYYPGLSVADNYLRRDVETRIVDECDYQPSVSTAVTEFGLRPGLHQLYSDGSTSNDGQETGVTSTQTTTQAVVAGRLKTIETGTDQTGRATPTTVSDGAQGGIPAAEICEADDVLRESEETFTFELCIARNDFEGTPVQDSTKPVELESRWVETDAEAEAWAALELRILHSMRVSLGLASPVPILDAGDLVLPLLPELGLDRLCKIWVSEITVEGGPGGRVRHALELLVPPLIE